jgi:hypothetical protein
MFRHYRALLALTFALVVLAGIPAAFAQEAAAQPPASAPKWVDTMRGTAEILFRKISAKVEGDVNVTTFEVKNTSPKAIARLTLEEYVYGAGVAEGVPITGDRTFLRKPLMPGEVATMVLHTPRKPGMVSNNFKFSHGQGDIKAKAAKVQGGVWTPLATR